MRYILALCLMFSVSSAMSRDLITKDNHCYLDGQVNNQSMSDLKDCLVTQVVKRGKKSYTIYLVLDSPGGSIYEGLRFIEFAEGFRGVETVTIFAASMAAEIAQALPGKRHVTRNGIMMFHRASGVFRGTFGDGEVEQQLKLWKYIVAKMEKKAAKRIGITHKAYQAKVKDEWWLYGKENATSNTADSVTSFNCSVDLMTSKLKRSVNTIFGKIEYSISACPFMN